MLIGSVDFSRPLTIIVFLFIARSMAFKSTLNVCGSSLTSLTVIPRYFAALSNAVCAVVGMTMLGRSIPLTSRPKSRYALQARKIDSVPKERNTNSRYVYHIAML